MLLCCAVPPVQLRHVAHQVVGNVEKRGISGGQRKRVNIGFELAVKPSLLWMDEPTSGLDSTAASDILHALKRMAHLGMTIVSAVGGWVWDMAGSLLAEAGTPCWWPSHWFWSAYLTVTLYRACPAGNSGHCGAPASLLRVPAV